MSMGCNIADQHHCIQVADDKLVKLLRKIFVEDARNPIGKLADSVVLLLPPTTEPVKLSALLGFQQHANIILVLEEGQCSVVDDLESEHDISLVSCKNTKLIFNFSVEESCKIKLDLYLQEGAKVDVQGLYRLKDESMVEILTGQNHLEPDAESNLLVKGVVEDKASIDYRGKIFVAQEAHGSNVSQKNKTLIMSPDAKALSIPSMEVLNRDVQCAHGSAVAQIDEQQLFYLMSRGLSRKHAIEMLVESFLG